MQKSASPVTRVKLGRSYGKFRADTNSLSTAIADKVMAEIGPQLASRFIKMQGKTLALNIAKRIRKEIGTIPITIANYAIGTAMSSYSTAVDYETDRIARTKVIFDTDTSPRGDVTWRNLSRRTIHRKRGKGGYVPRFFLETGALQAEIRNNKGLQALQGDRRGNANNKGFSVDGVTVKMLPWQGSHRSAPRFRIGELQVEMFPALRSSTISEAYDPYNPAMTIERRIGLSALSVRKLKGAVQGGRAVAFRPLFQPVLEHYLRNRIPRAIDRAVKRAQHNYTDTSALG